MKQLLLCLLSLGSISCGCSTLEQSPQITSYVDPYIGTGYHGHVFLGANVPFGAVQVGPTNITQGWDWASGYHYSDSTIIGFAHKHLSGTGIGDLGDIVLMPTVGDVPFIKGTEQDIENGYLSKFSHANETVTPGYYSVLLDKYNINVEITATERGAIHHYSYPSNAQNKQIIIDLESGIGWDEPTEGYLYKVAPNKVAGYRFSNGWAEGQRTYFVAEFSEPIADIVYYNDKENIDIKADGAAKDKRLKAFIKFAPACSEITTRVAISSVSINGAESNFQAEVAGKDFEDIATLASDKWNKFLSKFEVEGKNKEDIRAFYTALYHTAFAPQLFSDVNGDYRGADAQVYHSNKSMYSVYSLWDTYRAVHPLLTITAPDRVSDMVNNFVAIYQQQGKVPVWHLEGEENDCMVGYHSIPVIVDAYLKGIEGFDIDDAYKAITSYIHLNERGVNHVLEDGFIPAEREGESVAKALEYCIDDWAIAQMALKLGKKDDYEFFMKRSKNYTHYFDKESGFMRGKLSNGEFRTPFDPVKSTHRADDYCEGNAWQYTWLVPHDVEGLIDLFGSDKAFTNKLDSLFTISSDLGGASSPDISGLVGQYAQGNEPNHSTPFLYAYAGEQWKTAALTRHIMRTFFTDKPDGLCGNEDAGQMSAWYVFTATGFYPCNCSNGAFVLSSPLFDKVTINVDEDTAFTVIAENNSEENIYIQSATLNGESYPKTYITYKDIMSGGELKLVMGSTPNKAFGAEPANRPQSKTY